MRACVDFARPYVGALALIAIIVGPFIAREDARGEVIIDDENSDALLSYVISSMYCCEHLCRIYLY